MMIVLVPLNCVSPALLFDRLEREHAVEKAGREELTTCFFVSFWNKWTEISGFQLSKDRCYLIRNTECRSYILEEEHLV